MMRLIAAWIVAFVPVLAFVACATSPAAVPPISTSPQPPWLLTSDWHFNPYDDPKLLDDLIRAPAAQWRAILARSKNPINPYFRNTNFALLESALGEMRAVAPNPPVVMIAGDSLAHRFRETFFELEPNAPEKTFEAFVDKTMAFLASEFGRTYPRAQFLITIGNNDG